MDLRQLRYFLAIAAEGSFGLAAKRLYVAQPALSRHIRNLEEEFGVTLLSRSRHGVTLTTAGKVLAEHAQFLLQQAAVTRDAVVAEAAMPQGTVRLGTPPVIGSALCGDIAARYAGLHPQVTLGFREGMNHELLELLRTDQIDLAVVSLPEHRPPAALDNALAIQRFLSEEMIVFGPRNDRRLPAECEITDLADLPLIMTERSRLSRFLVESAAKALGIALNVRFETESLHTAKSLVNRGLGYGVIPCCGLYGESGAFRSSVIKGVTLVRGLAHRTDRPLSVAASELLRVTNECLGDLSDAGAFSMTRTPAHR